MLSSHGALCEAHLISFDLWVKNLICLGRELVAFFSGGFQVCPVLAQAMDNAVLVVVQRKKEKKRDNGEGESVRLQVVHTMNEHIVCMCKRKSLANDKCHIAPLASCCCLAGPWAVSAPVMLDKGGVVSVAGEETRGGEGVE